MHFASETEGQKINCPLSSLSANFPAGKKKLQVNRISLGYEWGALALFAEAQTHTLCFTVLL